MATLKQEILFPYIRYVSVHQMHQTLSLQPANSRHLSQIFLTTNEGNHLKQSQHYQMAFATGHCQQTEQHTITPEPVLQICV